MRTPSSHGLPRRLLREPLVHFLALGAALFPLFAAVGREEELVLVEARTEPRLPALGEFRDAVLRGWHAERAQAASEEFYRSLRTRYDVVVEAAPAAGTARPEPAPPGAR